MTVRRPSMRARMRHLACVAVLAVAVAASAAPSHGASSDVTVTFGVLSGTVIDTSGCGGSASARSVLAFGAVPAGSPARSPDCAISFGSLNDTSSLRMRQLDSNAGAMYGMPQGGLDLTWGSGSDGMRAYDLGGGFDYAYGGTLQGDGKFVIGARGTGNDLALLRILQDGSLDPDWDGPGAPGNGLFILNTAPGFGEVAYRIQSTPDGLLVPVGRAGSASVHVLRLDDTGAYDPGWGSGGSGSILVTAGRYVDLNAAAYADDGSVYVGGCVADADGCSGSSDIFVARFTPSGQPDDDFGGDGAITLDLGAADDLASMIDVQADGKVVVSATTAGNGWVGRFNEDGTLDTTGFNAPSGFRVLDHGSTDGFEYVGVKPDGRILVGGESIDGGQRKVTAIQLLANGALDTTGFGSGGWFIHQPAGSSQSGAEDIRILPDGSFLLTGRYNGNWGGATDMFLMRVHANGTIDTDFATAGTAAVSDQANGLGYAIEDFSDGRLAVVGNGTGDIQIAVFEAGTAIPDYAPGTNDFATAGSGLFGVCMESVTGASTTWTTNATCPLSDGHWRAVPGAGAGSVAASTAAAGLANATFAFGVRTQGSAPVGSYLAPIVFEVVAPA